MKSDEWLQGLGVRKKARGDNLSPDGDGSPRLDTLAKFQNSIFPSRESTQIMTQLSDQTDTRAFMDP